MADSRYPSTGWKNHQESEIATILVKISLLESDWTFLQRSNVAVPPALVGNVWHSDQNHFPSSSFWAHVAKSHAPKVDQIQRHQKPSFEEYPRNSHDPSSDWRHNEMSKFEDFEVDAPVVVLKKFQKVLLHLPKQSRDRLQSANLWGNSKHPKHSLASTHRTKKRYVSLHLSSCQCCEYPTRVSESQILSKGNG